MGNEKSGPIEKLRNRDFTGYHMGRKLNEIIDALNPIIELANTPVAYYTERSGYGDTGVGDEATFSVGQAPGADTSPSEHERDTTGGGKTLQDGTGGNEGQDPAVPDSPTEAGGNVPLPGTDNQ